MFSTAEFWTKFGGNYFNCLKSHHNCCNCLFQANRKVRHCSAGVMIMSHLWSSPARLVNQNKQTAPAWLMSPGNWFISSKLWNAGFVSSESDTASSHDKHEVNEDEALACKAMILPGRQTSDSVSSSKFHHLAFLVALVLPLGSQQI